MTETRLTEDPAATSWHLDKRVPLALIVTIIIQTLGFGFWAGQISTIVSNQGQQIAELASYQDRITRVETRVDAGNDTLTRIDARLERMEDRTFNR